MKKPEWRKALDEHQKIWNDNSALNLANHLGHDTNDPNGKIHRAVYVSTVSPANQDGNNGDIWITYEP